MESITQLTSDQDITKFTSTIFSDFANARINSTRESIECHNYFDGDHYGYLQSMGLPFVTNNNAFANLFGRKVMISSVLTESKRNMILQSNPTTVISPKMDPKDIEQSKKIARASEVAVKNVFGKERFETKSQEVVLNALLDHCAFFDLSSDPQGIHIGSWEYKDIFIPNNLKDLNKAPAVGKRFRATIGAYKNNPDYKNIDKLHGKSRGGGISYGIFGGEEATERERDESIYNTYTFTVKDFNQFEAVEWQILFTLGEDTIERLKNVKDCEFIKNKQPGDKILRIITVSETVVIRDQYKDSSSYYLYAYVPQGGNIYGRSLFYRMISMNKAYNNVWSMLEEYAAYAIKYRLLVDSQTIISPPDNINGGMILFEGTPPQELQHSDISPGIFNMLSKYEETMQMLMSVSPSSMGEVPGGDKMFKALESQKMQDMFNTRPMITNFASCMKGLSEGILDLIDDSYEIQDLAYEDTKGIHELQVVGNNYAQTAKRTIANRRARGEDIVIIKKDYPVEIRIAQGLDYTEASIQNQLLQLAQVQEPPNPVVPIEAWVSSVDQGAFMGIIDEARRAQQLRQQQQQAQQSPAPQGAPAGAPQQPSVPPGLNQAMATQVPGAEDPGVNPVETAGPSAPPLPPETTAQGHAQNIADILIHNNQGAGEAPDGPVGMANNPGSSPAVLSIMQQESQGNSSGKVPVPQA